MEGTRQRTRRLQASRRARGAGRAARGRAHHPRVPRLRGRASHRSTNRGVSTRRRRGTDRVVSRDGRAGRDRRRTRGDRECRSRDRSRARPVCTGSSTPFRPRVRAAYRADRTSGAMKLPMPLRVPELAPSLGRIIVPRRLFDPWVPVDDIREELATRVLELGGDGRAVAARDAEGERGQDRARILEVTGRGAWAAAWEHAVRRAGARVAEALEAEITRTARQVRLPRRRLRRRLLSNAEKRAIVARLGTGGGTFVAALDALETAGGRVADASVLEKDAHAEWQEALRTVARRLEAAWLALETEVDEERLRWTPEIDAVAAWRPPLWPIFVVWTPLSILLIWLGLILGGYLPAPAWLAAQL